MGPAVAALLLACLIAQQADTADVRPRNRDEWDFVGYHGTSSVYAPSIMAGINPPSTNEFGNQLGEGFYVTPDFALATKFAAAATGLLELEGKDGGTPVVLKVFARNFRQMTRKVVPVDMGDIPYEYITGYDYLMSQIAGFEPAIQYKFNPRVYTRLRATL